MLAQRAFDATDFFQIWFEPHLREAVRRSPEYHEATDSELPVSESAGVQVKSIIGGKSPIQLVVDARIEHLTVAPNAAYEFGEDASRTQAMVVVNGEFELHDGTDSRLVKPREFLVCDGRLHGAQLKAGTAGGEVVIVDVPTEVSYPLLSK